MRVYPITSSKKKRYYEMEENMNDSSSHILKIGLGRILLWELNKSEVVKAMNGAVYTNGSRYFSTSKQYSKSTQMKI